MELNWLEGILYGLFSGLTEILPVSAYAHKLLMLKIFGETEEPALMALLIHLGVLAALYYACQNHIIRILRAMRLARVPKRKRKRPLVTKSLMVFLLLRTMCIPVIVAFCFYNKLEPLRGNLIWMAVFVMINGFILYLPQFFPGGNKDCRTLSRVEGLLIGLGGAITILPGTSGIAGATSVGSLCGEDRTYSLNMILLLGIGIVAGYVALDVIQLVSVGAGGIRFGTLVSYILAAAAAFGGATAGIKILRRMAPEVGFAPFGLDCWGVSLFTLVLNLVA